MTQYHHPGGNGAPHKAFKQSSSPPAWKHQEASLLLYVNTGGVSKSQTSARTMPRQNLKILLCRVIEEQIHSLTHQIA